MSGIGKLAALGFRVHSGWAAVVAVDDELHIVLRRRITLVETETSEAKQPYHAAAKLDLESAAASIAYWEERSRALAARAVSEFAERGAAGAGLLLSSARPLPGLQAILASHALIHTAEGQHFRNAIRMACEGCGLALVEARERDVFDRAAQALGVTAAEFERRLAEEGRRLGPPWREDQKLATAAAWLAYAERGTPAKRRR